MALLRLRLLVNLGLWFVATFVVALLPLYIEVFRAGMVSGQSFQVSRAFTTISLLYVVLAVTASTIPSAVNWSFAAAQGSRVPVFAVFVALALSSGMVLVGSAIGVAAANGELVRELSLPSCFGILMVTVLGLAIAGCTSVAVADVREEW